MMTEVDKSIYLLSAIGKTPFLKDRGVRFVNFYHPENIEYAWYVLSWANSEEGLKLDGVDWWRAFISDLVMLPLEKAQTLWLDRVLQICVNDNRFGDRVSINL